MASCGGGGGGTCDGALDAREEQNPSIRIQLPVQALPKAVHHLLS